MFFKKARIATGATPKWKRCYKVKAVDISRQGELPQPDVQRGEAEDESRPTYTSRILRCTRCGEGQETAWMQLKNLEGFRAIHCKACGMQERCIRNQCQCNKTWHHCVEHRTDPPFHRSRKAPKRTPEEKKKYEEEQVAKTRKSRKRKSSQAPPTIDDDHQLIQNRKGLANKYAKQRAYTLKRMKLGIVHTKPETPLLARVRKRIKEGLKEASRAQVKEPTMHNDDPCTQWEASRASRIEENTRALEIRSPAMPPSRYSARKSFTESLRERITQQALISSKRRRLDDDNKPSPYNSDGGPKVKGQGEKTHEPSDQVQDTRIYRRDLHEHEVIARLICKQPR